MSDRCDVAGCEEAPALYGPSGRRCMAHVPREAPLRSDVPPLRRARIRLAFAEIARAEAVRAGAAERETGDELATMLRETTGHLAAEQERAEAATGRLAEVERVLTRWPWDGAAALRVLRGEPIVRERGETTTDEEMTR